MKRLIVILLIINVANFMLPNNALALRLNVLTFDKTRSNPDPNNPIYYLTGVFGWNYVMSSPRITYRHVSSIHLFRSDRWGYEIGWRWPRGGEPQLFVVTMEDGVYNQKIIRSLPRNSNQPYYMVIDSATSGDVIFVWNNQEVYRKHAVFPDARAMTGSERQCDGLCELQSIYPYNCYSNNCMCGLSKLDCGWETNYSHFCGLTKRRHDFSWVNWENLQLYFDDDWEYYLYKISNTNHKVQR